MQHPLISVVVPAYNEEKTLPACLNSLLNQDCTFPYEIIVVDNASTDRTAEIARQYNARLLREPVKGVASARRAGFAAARADLIASTDADCVAPSDWLAQIRRAFTKQPELIAVGGYTLFYDAPYGLNFFPRLTHRLNAMRLVGGFVGQQPLSTQNLAVRKTAYQQVGGFNPAITSPLGLDDVDLTLRLSALGPVAVLPSPVVWASARRYRQAPVRTIGYRWANYASYALLRRGVFRRASADIRL